ncbi:MAG: DUF4238 domain-containing protein [Bacteroidia bacterium]
MNHHYVSQVLSRKFFNSDKTTYQYNKTTKRTKKLRSTKSLFSVKHLNTKLDEEGNIDYSSTEDTLNRYFETDLNKHYNRIIAIVNGDNKVGELIPNSENVIESMQFLIGMGIIGEMRTPWHMTEAAETIFAPLLMIAEGATEELRNNILGYRNMLSGFINKIPLDFKEIKDGVAQLMGETTYSIYTAPKDHYFILPDCTSRIKRYKLVEDDIIDGQTYINPQMSIGMVIMPLNSKIIISANARKLITTNNGAHGLYKLKPEVANDFNLILYEAARQGVVCENEEYLKKIVAGI